jgi:hypothetical protein
VTIATTRHDTPDTTPTGLLPAIPTPATPDRVVSPYLPPAPYQPAPRDILTPRHLADLIGTPTLPLPAPLQRLKNAGTHASTSHLLPGLGVLTLAGVSALAHTQPYHPLIGGVMLAGGVVLACTGIGAHHKHGAAADVAFTRGALGAGGALALTGVGACAGASPWTAVAAALTTGGAYVAWHQWSHHKLERRRAAAVALVAAGNTGRAPAAAIPWTASPGVLPVSDEEARIHAAFARLKASPVIVSPVRRDGDVWSVYVDLMETAKTADEVARAADKLATWMGARNVEVLPGTRRSQVKLVVYDGDDALEDAIPGPGPVAASILDPIGIGLFEDATEITQRLAWNHILLAGASDNGKSGVANAILIGTLACRDVVRVLVDCKAGAPEFGVYEPVAFSFADTPEAGMRVLAGLEAMYEYRGGLLAEKGVASEENEDGVPVRKWRPEFGPFVLAAIDELAELTRAKPAAAARIQTLRAVTRYVGIIGLDATQTPSRQVFGGRTDARLNYQVRIGLKTSEQGAIRMIMGEGAVGQGWRLNRLDAVGKLMIQSREHDRPRVGRGYWYTDEEIARYVAEYRSQVEDLDEGSAAAYWEGYNNAEQATDADGGGDDGPRGGRPVDPVDVAQAYHRGGRTLYVVPTYPDGRTAVESQYRDLWALLIEQAGPVAAPELAALAKSRAHATCSESWVRGVMRYWVRNGWVCSEKRSGTDFFWPAAGVPARRDA